MKLLVSNNIYRTYARFLSTQQYKKVTHVLFDLDGLLLDTEGIYRDVISGIAKEHGKVYTAELRTKVLGRQELDCCKICIKEMNLPVKLDYFLGEFRNRSAELLKKCPLMPGAEKYVRHLHSKQIPIAVATSSSCTSFHNKTEVHREFFSMFHHAVTGATDPDVKRGKPHPDIFLVCASRFPNPPAPSACLVMEDAPNGVSAAISAGMQCVVVPDGLTPHSLCKDATLILPSLEELQPEMFGLPAYGEK